MSDTTIQLSADAKRRLDLHRRDGESYDDVIRRLIDGDRWAGFGAFDEADADEVAEGVSKKSGTERGGHGANRAD